MYSHDISTIECYQPQSQLCRPSAFTMTCRIKIQVLSSREFQNSTFGYHPRTGLLIISQSPAHLPYLSTNLQAQYQFPPVNWQKPNRKQTNPLPTIRCPPNDSQNQCLHPHPHRLRPLGIGVSCWQSQLRPSAALSRAIAPRSHVTLFHGLVTERGERHRQAAKGSRGRDGDDVCSSNKVALGEKFVRVFWSARGRRDGWSFSTRRGRASCLRRAKADC
jgi:hypothetical protein